MNRSKIITSLILDSLYKNMNFFMLKVYFFNFYTLTSYGLCSIRLIVFRVKNEVVIQNKSLFFFQPERPDFSRLYFPL